MKDVSLGQYYAKDSIIHRLDPRLKMLLVLAYIVLCLFFVDTFLVYGIILITTIIVIALAKLPFFKVLRALSAILFLMLFSLLLTLFFSSGQPNETPFFSSGPVSVYPSTLVNVGLLAARLSLMMLAPTIVSMATTPMELSDALEWYLTPLALIKVPVWAFALVLNIALKMIPVLSQETTKIIEAQKSRGADFESRNIFRRLKTLLAILIPLFISSFSRASDLADAMDSRCFKGGKRRKMKKLRFHYRDLIALFLFAGFFFFVLLFYYNWWNIPGIAWLRVVTMP